MSQRIKNGYVMAMWVKIKEEQWFGLDFFFSFFTAIIQMAVFYYLFKVVFAHSTTIRPAELTTYYVFATLIADAYQPAMYGAYDHMTEINTGKMVPFLLRPNNYMLMRYLEKAGVFLLHMLINFAIMWGACLWFHEEFGIYQVIVGAYSMVAGFSILYLIQSVIGCLAVWFYEINHIRNVVMTVLMIFGGQLIPSEYLFSWVKSAVYYTPLPYIYNVPIHVLMGKATTKELLIQIMWLIVFSSIYVWLFESKVAHNVERGN